MHFLGLHPTTDEIATSVPINRPNYSLSNDGFDDAEIGAYVKTKQIAKALGYSKVTWQRFETEEADNSKATPEAVTKVGTNKTSQEEEKETKRCRARSIGPNSRAGA